MPSHLSHKLTSPDRNGRFDQWAVCRTYCTASAGSLPEGRPQDAVPDDKVEFLQVRGGSLLKHAVSLQAVVTLCQPSGHLTQRHIYKNLNLNPWSLTLELGGLCKNVTMNFWFGAICYCSGCWVGSYLLRDLGFPLQSKRHQLMSDAVSLLAVDGAALWAKKKSTGRRSTSRTSAHMLCISHSSHLSFHFQLLQLSLVSSLAEGLINLGHDGDFLAAVVDDQLTFRLWQIPHEPEYGDPNG